MIKKLLILIMTLSVILAITSCDFHEERYFLVKFYVGSNQVEEQRVLEGETLAEPIQPVLEGFVFLHWVDEDGNEYSFDKPITSNLTLTALWKRSEEPPEKEKVRVRFFDAEGNQIGNDQIIDKGDAAKAPALMAEKFFVYEWDSDYSCVMSDLDVHAVKKYDAANSELFTYAKDGESYMITGVADGKELPHMSNGFVELALPETYDDLPISSVGDGAFEDKNIYSLYIPSCYTKIGAAAFKGNASLSNVVFNEGLVEIGEWAFTASEVKDSSISDPIYVSGLNRLEFPSTLTTIGDYAFFQIGRYLMGNTFVELPVKADFSKCHSLKHIGNHAFEGAMIQSLFLPETDWSLHIGDYAFAADTFFNHSMTGSYEFPRSQLKDITLPSSVSYIGDYAFYGGGAVYSYYNGSLIKTQMPVTFDCDSLTLEYLGKSAFMDSMLIGSLNLSVPIVGEFAFYENRFLSINLNNVIEIGEFAFARSSGDDAVTVNLSEELVSIDNYAFYNNSGLESVNFPSSLEQIGESAFEGCSSLGGELVLPASLHTLGGWAFSLTSIESVKIEGDIKLMQQCFSLCTRLESVEGNIVFAGQSVFNGCSNLKKVTLSDSMTDISYGLFYGCESLESIKLPSSLVKIEDFAFGHCALEKITIPQNVNKIGQRAFELCLSLTQVVFAGDVLQTIEPYAFNLCPALTDISLPDSVEYIGDFAFEGSGLTSFKTPAALKMMGYGVFNRWEFTVVSDDSTVMLPVLDAFIVSAETGVINFDAKGTFYGSEVYGFEVESGNKAYSSYDGILYSADRKKLIMYPRNSSLESVELIDGLEELSSGAFMNCPQLKRVILPQSLTVICDYAFYNCPKLQSIDIPASVKRIGSYAFAGSSETSSSLGEIRFEGESVTEIGSYAFADNNALTSVKIPSSVEIIGNGAFYNCSALASLDLSEASGLKQIGDSAFSGRAKEFAPKIESLDFGACTALKSTGAFAFSQCADLKEINFGKLTEIDSGAFYKCVGLKKLTLGSFVEQIYEYAFSQCTSLIDIIVPKNNALSIIKEYAFAGKQGENMNFKVLDLTNAEKLTVIDEGAFSYGNVEEVYLPYSRFKLSNEVFDRCTSLTKIDFGGVVEIGENVLSFCNQIKTLNIPSTVNTINNGAFRDLDIEEVNIGTPKEGNSLYYIGKNSFFNCTKLKSVNIYGKNVPALSGNEYNYSFFYLSGNNQNIIEGLSIVVDAGMKDAYLSSTYDVGGWQVYEAIIVERID